MRFSSEQCEKEGCTEKPTFIVINYSRSWMWVACTDHEADKAAEELSVALPLPPEP
jgi:hypothetical protein